MQTYIAKKKANNLVIVVVAGIKYIAAFHNTGKSATYKSSISNPMSNTAFIPISNGERSVMYFNVGLSSIYYFTWSLPAYIIFVLTT